MPPWASRWGGVEGQWGIALAPRSIVIERIAAERAAELLRTVNNTTATSRSAFSQSGGGLGRLGWAGDEGEGRHAASYSLVYSSVYDYQLVIKSVCGATHMYN